MTEKAYSGIFPQEGYNGDEDQGQMGALAVLLKTGLFSMRGGTSPEPVYELGSPLFDKITIQLNNDYYPGDRFVIETKNNSSENCYIRSVTLNGKNINKIWLYHKDIARGGQLVLEMDNQPNKQIPGI